MKGKGHHRLIGAVLCTVAFFFFIFAADFSWRFDGHSTGSLKPAERAQVHAEQMQQTVMIAQPLPLTKSGEIDYSSMALTPVLVVPRIGQTQAESAYEIVFTAAKDIPVGGHISISLPTGFGFSPSCQTLPGAPENNDLNGSSAGTVVVTSISCRTLGSHIGVKIGGAPVRMGDRVRFFIQGVVNGGEARVPPSQGYLAVIITKDAADGFLEQRTSLPFFLAPAGERKVSGVLFNDNGAGLFGFARDGIQNGEEPGLLGSEVCLSGMSGIRCAKTDTNGFYQFTKVNEGYYAISVMTPSAGDVVGGPFFVDVELSGGQNRTGLNFAFSPAQRTIMATVRNIPRETTVRVTASGGVDGAGFVVREIAWNGQETRAVSLPVSDGIWSVGVESTDAFTSGFIPPRSRDVAVSGSGDYRVDLTLRSAHLLVSGRVIDRSGRGVPGAFIVASPHVFTGGVVKESVTRSLNDGSFQLKVVAGSYRVDVSMPGMPAVKGIDIDVREDTGNSAIDKNASADVYHSGTLLTNDTRANSVTFIISKGEYSISGRVLDENGGPIAFATVSAQEIDAQGRMIGARVERPTDATGLYTLFVTNGRWRMGASAPTSGEIPSTIVTVAGTNVSSQDLRVSVANLGTIKGRVTKGGAPVAGASISVSGLVGAEMGTTDTEGRYAVRVAAGSGYTIEARVAGAGRLASLENVTVTAGATVSGQDLSISTTGTVVVTIPGISDARVEARDANRNGDETTKNPTPGTYTISVPAGTYTVTARNGSYGEIGSKAEVRVLPGEETRVSFTPPTPSIVSGVLKSSATQCIDRVAVTAINVQKGLTIETITDAAGVYSFSLLDGAYTLTATKQGCIDEPEPFIFVVRRSRVAHPPRTLTQAVSPISGIVSLSGAPITLETKVIAKNTDQNVQSTAVDTAITTGNNYTLNVTPGVWQVYARADGYESAKHTITVGVSGATQNMSMATIPGYVPAEPVLTPIAPSKGGVVKNNDAGEKFAIVFPAGALGSSSDSGSVSTKVTTAVVVKTATAEVVGGKGIEITPKDATGRPLTSLSATGSDASITLPYSKAEVAALGIQATVLTLAVWSEDKQQWTPFPTTVDTVNTTLSGVPPHFSIFAPIVPAVSSSVVSEALEQLAAVQETGGSQGISTGGTGFVSVGTVLVRPEENKQNQESGIRNQGDEHARSNKEQLIVSEPLVVEEETRSEEISGLDLRRSLSQVPSRDRNDIMVRGDEKLPLFPDGRKAERKLGQEQILQEQKLSQTPIEPKSVFLDDIFEISVVIEEESRVLVEGGTLFVRGELLKSDTTPENILLRFTIRDGHGRVLSEEVESVLVGDHAAFTKTFEIEEGIEYGFYTITLEAVRGEERISASDRFEARGERSQQILQEQTLSQTLIEPDTVFPAIGVKEALSIGVLLLLALAGLAWMWYTVRNVL